MGNESHTLFLRNGLDLYDQFEQIYENCDIDEIKKQLKIPEDSFILLMASRLTSWKRVDRGIKALKTVLENRKDVILIIAGDGDSRSKLETLAADYGIQDHVVFLGSVPQSKVYQYMICADVFLSLYDLGNLGNPTFEAMLMKTAIIALNGGDTSTVIHNGENGILLEYEQEKDIPKAIEKLLNDDEYRNKISDNAFRFAKENFYSWKTRMKLEEEEILKLFKN